METTRIMHFLNNPEGPIGMLLGGIIVALGFYGVVHRYYELPEKVNNNIERIQNVRASTNENDEDIEDLSRRMDELRGSLKDVNDNQRLVICNAPFIGESWKQKKDCKEFE